MSHEFESGMFVKDAAWHGLGTVIQKAPTLADGIKLAGLDWTVGLHPMVAKVNGQEVETNHFAVARNTDNRVLGVVTDRYTPLQNNEAFNWFQPFIDGGEAELHTAGSLCEGEKVWVLAKINRPDMEIVKGDSVAKFIMLSNGHTGMNAVRVGMTNIRIVCANTLAMAHADKASQLIRVRHSANVVANLEAIRDVINAIDASFEATAEQYRLLARKTINQNDIRKYVQLIMDVGDVDESDLPTRTKNAINNIVSLIETGKGADIPGVKGTLWGVYNAYSEMLSWEAGRTTNNRFDSLWFGLNGAKNKRALQIALDMAV